MQRPVVIKLGSSTVTDGGRVPSEQRMDEIFEQIASVWRLGQPLVMVSSGAVATGRGVLSTGLTDTDSVSAKQVLAAIGQPRLMALYQSLAKRHGLLTAQVLLTRADLENRRRYLNARDTLLGLLRAGVLPVVNENDTVATEEIRVGDNDMLSAMVAGVVDAQLLVLLTDQEGVYDRDPRAHGDATLLREIPPGPLPQALRDAVQGPAGQQGTGGMGSKLAAAELARRHGCPCVITRGSTPAVLPRILAGEALGTRFVAASSVPEARKRYMLSAAKASGALSIDAGAVQALLQGRSLLAVGVTEVHGRFDRGDPIQLRDAQGAVLAHGLSSYTSADLQRLQGRRSSDIAQMLGYHYGDAVVHRDNLVMLEA